MNPAREVKTERFSRTDGKTPAFVEGEVQRFKEKGGKEKELSVHHKLEELLDQYLKTTGLGKDPESPLFPASIGKTGNLSGRPLVRTDAANMPKRRLKQGWVASLFAHSFLATGITNFLENDGTLEAARRIAGHADSRTIKLYDRRGSEGLCSRIWSASGTEDWRYSVNSPINRSILDTTKL
jgi:site-specific recombinase XerC